MAPVSDVVALVDMGMVSGCGSRVAPRDWRSGWALLTWSNDQLQWPELCFADDATGTWQWRGQIYRAETVH